MCSPVFVSAQDTNSPDKITDVNIIVGKANIMAYYQGDDGKAKVKMTITDKKGRPACVSS
jgi:hypothetical protein